MLLLKRIKYTCEINRACINIRFYNIEKFLRTLRPRALMKTWLDYNHKTTRWISFFKFFVEVLPFYELRCNNYNGTVVISLLISLRFDVNETSKF